MSRRTLCQLVTMFLLGMAYKIYDDCRFAAAGVIFSMFLLWHMRRHIEKRVRRFLLGIAALVMFFGGAYRGGMANDFCMSAEKLLSEGRQVSFQGEIYEKETKADKMIYYMREVILQADGKRLSCPSVILYPNSDEDSIGTIYIGTAYVKEFETSPNAGGFDEKNFYYGNAVFGKLIKPEIHRKIDAKTKYRQALFECRQRIRTVYESILPAEEAGILSAIVLGDKSILEKEAKELFQMAGIAHILAISGLHISLVGHAVYRFLRKRGMRFVSSSTTAFAFVWLYGQMSGMSKSALRAIWMFFFLMLANMLGRSYDSLTALAVTAFLMFSENPIYLKNTGVIFSFMAVIGVVTIGESFQKDFGRKELQALGIQLFTMPLVAQFYYEIPIYSVFLNILLLPFLPLLFAGGLLGGILGIRFAGIGRWLLLPCHGIMFGYEWLCAMSLKLPAAIQIVGQLSPEKIIVLYAILYIFAYGVKKKGYKIAGYFLFALLLFFPRTPEFRVEILDVGQGDAVYVESAEGVRFFIDGGSSNVNEVGKYRILPFLKSQGIRKIDYWFVSHPDEDHVSGLLECMEKGYVIRNLVFSDKVVKNENFERIKKTAAQKNCNVIYMKCGEKIKTKSTEWLCLLPEKAEEDANGSSLVLLLKTDAFRGIFTGDIGEAQETVLANRHIGRVQFLKAAHHGSNYANTEIFLQSIRPDIVSISCAYKNRYGHPGAEAVERIEHAGSKIFYTMKDGQITIKKNKKGEILITTRDCKAKREEK